MRRLCFRARRRPDIAVWAGLAVLCAVPGPASAYPLLFSFTGGESGSFQVDSNPTPNYLDATSFGAPISAATGDFSGAGGAEFYLPSGGGGLALYAGPGASTFIGLDGPQLFSGTLTSPVFAPGHFLLQTSGGAAATELVITGPGAPAPELGAGWTAVAAALLMLMLSRTRRSHFGAPAR